MKKKGFKIDNLKKKLSSGEYIKKYKEEEFLDKLKRNFSKAGVSVVYGVLLLFYSLKDPNVPTKAKGTIIAALGYFVAPLDLVTDFIPLAGYGDDLTAIIISLGIISMYITDETKSKAKKKTKDLFGKIDDSSFEEVDEKLK